RLGAEMFEETLDAIHDSVTPSGSEGPGRPGGAVTWPSGATHAPRPLAPARGDTAQVVNFIAFSGDPSTPLRLRSGSLGMAALSSSAPPPAAHPCPRARSDSRSRSRPSESRSRIAAAIPPRGPTRAPE